MKKITSMKTLALIALLLTGTLSSLARDVSKEATTTEAGTFSTFIYDCTEGVNLYSPKVLAADSAEVDVTFNFADENFRENVGTALADPVGNIYNETFTVDGATLQVTAGSAASKLYVDSKRGQNLVTYKEYSTLTFRAPEGKAITKIEFTAAGSSNIDKLTASSGAIEGMTWTGNADGVRFAQGGTSYLANAVVTLVSKTDETTALPEIEYTECASISDFNALDAGTYAKVTLTDAEVSGISADGFSTAWIQDATGGCWIQYCSLIGQLQESTKVNGTVYVVARLNSGNVQMKEAEGTINSELAATAIDELTVAATGSISDVNVDDNKNQVVTITGSVLTLKEAGKTSGTLTDGDVTLAINNGGETANQQLHKLASMDDYMDKQVVVTGILVGKSASENQILPISIDIEEGYQMGDVNHDGTVDIHDVNSLVNYILGGTNTDTFYEEQADINEDGIISVSDVFKAVSISLGN